MNIESSKHMVIVNYDFPPAGGAGIKRCLKFMKFLPNHGWKMSVLTVTNGNHSIMDPSLVAEVAPGVEIYRTYSFETLFGRTTATDMKDPSLAIPKTTIKSGRSIQKLFRAFFNMFGPYFKIPDSRMLWFPSAVVMGIWINFLRHFDIIFATGPTFVNLIVAAFLKKICRKPLIVDFRDAWLADPMLLKSVKKHLLPFNRMLERFVVMNADCVITTNSFVSADFARRYPSSDQSKYLTIYNGYDADDFAFINDYKGVQETECFTIVYTGRLYAERTPEHFLRALRQAIQTNPNMVGETKVIFVGSCEKFLDGRHIEDYIAEFSLDPFVEITGHVTRKKSLEYQMSASVLLLLIGIVPPEMELTYGLSGKVFDYLLSEKPILTLANGGATREFIVAHDIGAIFYHSETNAIASFLVDAFNRFKQKTLKADKNLSTYQAFDFRALTSVLAQNAFRLCQQHQH